MNKMNPCAVGGALAITAAIVYLACALAVYLWPGGTLEFFNAWFHGLDLNALKTTKPFTFGTLLYGLGSAAVTAFLAGAVFAVSYNLIGLCPGCRNRK